MHIFRLFKNAATSVLLLAVAPAGAATSIYSESYRDFFSSKIIQYQRLRQDQRIGAIDGKEVQVFGALSHEIYSTRSLFSLEGGVELILSPNWRVQSAVRWLNFNQKSSEDMQTRSGLLGGQFLELQKSWLYLEDYLEGYLLVPGHSKAQFVGSASGRLVFRGSTRNHWIVDYAVAELRGYRASNPEYAGKSYLAGNLGPRLSYWWNLNDQNQGSVGLYVARGLVWAEREATRSSDWFLLTVGASF